MYSVEPFQSADAAQIPRLFTEVYGDSYPVKMVYDPDEIVTAFESRRYFPFLVRTASNSIIAYAALYKSAPFEGIYEFGQAVVSSEYRGSGIGRMLFEYVEKHAPALPGSEMYFGEAVCNHTHTQKAGVLIKTIETGIEIDLLPGITDSNGIPSGRVAALDSFRTFVSKPHTVYVPEGYEDILRFVYEGFDDSRTLAVSPGTLPSTRLSEMTFQIYNFAGVARVAVTMAGRDFENAFIRHENTILNRNIRVIQVYLKLSWPWIGAVVDVLRNRGYFFGGAFPRWFDDDGLFMQKIFGQPNWEGIRLFSTRAEKILGFIHDDWIRAKSHSSRGNV